MRTKEGNKEKDILDAAIKVFAEYGYQKSKMQKIAETAGVSTGSVYVYYESKEAIFIQLVEQLWSDLHRQLISIEKREDLNAINKFDSLIDILFDAFIDRPNLALAIVSELNDALEQTHKAFLGSYRQFMELGKKIVLKGIEEKIMSPNFDTEIIGSFIFGGVRILLHQWAHDPKNISINLLRQNVKYFCKRGMLNPA